MSTAPHRWLTLVIVSQFAFGLLAMTICLPSLQDWPAIFGASQAAVQLTFGGFVATYGALQLFYGPLSDRHGRKPILVTGLVLASAALLLAAVAPNLPVLVAARVLQGAGCAACMVVGRALIQDHFSGPERTRAMAYVGMTMGLCPPAATLIGGQLHVRLGWQSNFFLMAAVGLVLTAVTWRILPSGRPASAGSTQGGWRQLFAGYAQLARTPAFLGFATILAMSTAAFYAFLGGAPIVLARYGVTPDRIGLYIMCPPIAYILGNLATSRIAHRLGDRRLMVLGQVVTTAGMLLMLAVGLAGIHTPLALVLPLAFLGIGHGFLVAPTLANTVGLVPALAGSAAAVAGVMQQFVGALGGYTVGLVPHEGPVNLALMMLGWTLVGFAVQVALLRGIARR
jgi:DHA1 family bicyclomycin/chloramphenicol resistance-like MFS transporter